MKLGVMKGSILSLKKIPRTGKMPAEEVGAVFPCVGLVSR